MPLHVHTGSPRTTNAQTESGSTRFSNPTGLIYQIWRGFPLTSQRFSGNLQRSWGLGARFIRKVLEVSLPGRSVYRWLIMQIVLAGLALLFSMMPDKFFVFGVIQWLLTTVLVLSILDIAASVLLNHPNRTSQSLVALFKVYASLRSSCFYDLVLHPLLVLCIFRIIRTQSYLIFHGEENNFNDDDTWDFATFTVVASLYVMIVYVLRFSAFSSAASSLLLNHTTVSGSRTFGVVFMRGFLIQIALQVAIQIMFLMMISVRYQAERGGGEYYAMRQDGDEVDEVVIEEGLSRFLKVMIAGGILIPMLALPMYFVSAQKLGEEFPISLFLNSPSEQRAIRNTNRNQADAFKTEFARFHKYNASFVGGVANLLQPLFSPVQIVPCALYTLLLLSFFVCFGVTHVVNGNTGKIETVNAFDAGLYSNIYNMPLSVTKGTFAVCLLTVIAANILPMIYGAVGALLLPLHCTVGPVWLVVKLLRSRNYLSVQSHQTV